MANINLCFIGAQVWNLIQENTKPEKRNNFKKLLKKSVLSTLAQIRDALYNQYTL